MARDTVERTYRRPSGRLHYEVLSQLRGVELAIELAFSFYGAEGYAMPKVGDFWSCRQLA